VWNLLCWNIDRLPAVRKFVAVLVRGGFTVKLIKKRQGPSLARAPSKALVTAPVVCSHCHIFF